MVTDRAGLEEGVLCLLAGEPPAEVAQRLSLHVDDLVEAAERYHTAGSAALEGHDGWRQFTVDFTDWRAAERIAVAQFAPVLVQGGSRWFFTRKGASWRIRIQNPNEGMTSLLDALASDFSINGWRPGIYEAETYAFGGIAGMETTHQLFHTDSAAILRHLARESLVHRRRTEISILLCVRLLRGAKLDWYEQGDVWARVAAHRPAPDGPRHRLSTALHRLLTTDAWAVANSPLTPFQGWGAAFERAGHELWRLSASDNLNCGVRAVLAQHVLFHWNRIGLPADAQGSLAAHSRDLVMNGCAPAEPETPSGHAETR